MKPWMKAATRLALRGARTLNQVEVIIIDGNDAIENVKAVPTLGGFERIDLDEIAGKTEFLQWIVEAEDLSFGEAEPRRPSSGWEVHWIHNDGRTFVYMILADNTNEAFSVMEPPHDSLYRLLTKLDRIEPA